MRIIFFFSSFNSPPLSFSSYKLHSTNASFYIITDKDKLESQYSSQPSELVVYGTLPDTRIQSFEDYEWEQNRMIRYRPNDKGGIEPKGYDY